MKGRSGATVVGLPLSSTATMVKKQLLTWRLSWVRMFSAITLMPTSMEEVPVWLTEARKVTSSPTWIGWRNITWSTLSVTT
ncbi:hypothetical protein Y695_04840 [Hydrogenophaga sp. T4]|nr:hypothetical protein Y695_04840 [Hydrogenophaga sp. T4]